MITTLLLGIAVLFMAILLMGIKVFFTKNGEFPNTHIGGSKAMRERESAVPHLKTEKHQTE